jgi:hypothetical protein
MVLVVRGLAHYPHVVQPVNNKQHNTAPQQPGNQRNSLRRTASTAAGNLASAAVHQPESNLATWRHNRINGWQYVNETKPGKHGSFWLHRQTQTDTATQQYRSDDLAAPAGTAMMVSATT